MIPHLTSCAPLQKWIEDIATLCQPDSIKLCNGSEQEYQQLCQEMVEKGTFIALNQTKRPNSYLTRSAPDDVARLENRTFICSKASEEAGPTNHWHDPNEMKALLGDLFQGCMKGRTLY